MLFNTTDCYEYTIIYPFADADSATVPFGAPSVVQFIVRSVGPSVDGESIRPPFIPESEGV